MQILIDIPDNYLKGKKIENGSLACQRILDAVYNGTPLSEGHGDLIDRNEVLSLPRNRTYKLSGVTVNESIDVDLIEDLPSVYTAKKE